MIKEEVQKSESITSESLIKSTIINTMENRARDTVERLEMTLDKSQRRYFTWL